MLIDGAQAVPHQPVNVQDLDCDFFVFCGHKTLGPPGSGALWARREILEEMPPFMGGGEMIREVHLRHSTCNEVPYKFEAGTPDIRAAIGLGAALDYLTDLGMEHVRAHEQELVDYALDDAAASEVPTIRIHGPHVGRATVPGSSRSTSRMHIRTMSLRFSTARQSRSVPATTARCRSTSGSARRPARGRASTSTPIVTTSTDWPMRSTRSSASSPRAPRRNSRLANPKAEMDDLYRDEILEHYRNPHNFGILEVADDLKEGANPLCGDRITLMLNIGDDNTVQGRGLHRPRLRHQPGVGEHADRRDQGQVPRRDLAHGPPDVLDNLGIEISPARMKCAMLSLETLRDATSDRVEWTGSR